MSGTQQEGPTAGFDRRSLLLGGGCTLAAVASIPLVRHWLGGSADVFVARSQRYDGPLRKTIADGLIATGTKPAAMRGRRVLLKPNMVEPNRDAPHMTTHPAMVAAVAEVFLAWGAHVTVGEAPGHVRDTEMALEVSGIESALDDLKLTFADLNYESAVWFENRGGASTLEGFWFPQSIAAADLVVSMPKLKTHHWVGLTASMKNLYGTLPGLYYGWPKNVLHFNGIPQTVHDINASLPPTLTVIDAIDCMQGDGPIMGTLKKMGLVIVGNNLPAVDATCARIMGLRPDRVSYLSIAGKLGPISDHLIRQQGEAWQDVANRFQILDEPHLRPLRAAGGPLVT